MGVFHHAIEAMRVKELNDLNAAIEAQEKHLDDLHSKLDENGKVGWGRWALTYVTFGYYDNAEEIQKKIDETSQSLQENQEKRKVVVDFSAEYKENEAKLQEMYDKEAEASKNALAVKIDNINTEFSEREAILKQLIHEAEVRDSLSFEVHPTSAYRSLLRPSFFSLKFSIAKTISPVFCPLVLQFQSKRSNKIILSRKERKGRKEEKC